MLVSPIWCSVSPRNGKRYSWPRSPANRLTYDYRLADDCTIDDRLQRVSRLIEPELVRNAQRGFRPMAASRALRNAGGPRPLQNLQSCRSRLTTQILLASSHPDHRLLVQLDY